MKGAKTENVVANGNHLGKGPLRGILVMDLSDEKAVFCGKVLADLGAEVIRLESLARGPAVEAAYGGTGPFVSEKALFDLYASACKKKMALDIERESDRKLLLQNISHFDLVVESFAPGHLARLGLDFPSLIEINPALVMISISGFGRHGPRSGFKSCDLVAAALGGQMYVTGSPAGAPLKAPGAQSCYTAGLYGVVGSLLGLRRRSRTGKGVHVDISLQEAVASTLDHVLTQYVHGGVTAKRRGDRHWNDFFCILPCEDGFVHLTPLLEWEMLTALLEGEGMAADLKGPQWVAPAYRGSHIEHVLEVLGKWTRGHRVEELFELGQALRLPWAPVCPPRQILESPQLRSRQFFIERHFPRPGKKIAFPGSPYRSSLYPEGPATETFGRFEDEYPHFRTWRPPEKPKGGQRSVQVHPLAENRKENGILSGIRVMDLSRVVAGPYATRILADFGAEVIKVQSRKTATGAESNTGAYFTRWNRNKKSVCLDMSHPEAREIALKLVSVSDVVVENFSPRVMANWNLDYERLRAARQDVIVLAMSGMGQTGPWKDFVAYGPTVQSLGGLTFLTAGADGAPMGLGYSHADAISGIYGAIAVLAALEERDRTGKGQHIDLSEYEAVCTLIGPALLAACLCPEKAHSGPNRPIDPRSAPSGCYRCFGEDRWCTIAVHDEAEWNSLCKTSGHLEWAVDPRFITSALRAEHADDLDFLIERWTSRMRAEDVMAHLQAAGVAAGVVQNAGDLLRDPQLRDRAFFKEMDHPLAGKTVADRSPVRMEGVIDGEWTPSPSLGGDNRYVYLDLLGFTESELEAYLKKGVIG